MIHPANHGVTGSAAIAKLVMAMAAFGCSSAASGTLYLLATELEMHRTTGSRRRGRPLKLFGPVPILYVPSHGASNAFRNAYGRVPRQEPAGPRDICHSRRWISWILGLISDLRGTANSILNNQNEILDRRGAFSPRI